jgi:hypothetical protein
MTFVKISRVLVNAVTGRIEAGHDRRVRGKGLGNGRIRLPEAPPSRRQRVEGRRLDALRLRTDRVARVVSSVTSRIEGRASARGAAVPGVGFEQPADAAAMATISSAAVLGITLGL